MKPDISLDLIDAWKDRQSARRIWQDLESCGNTCYFLSWGWIENWLFSLPEHARPAMAVVRRGDAELGAFFLGSARIRRHCVINSRGLHFNATGIPSYDRVWIVNNWLLCRQRGAFRLNDLLKCLPESWEELSLPGLDVREFPGNEALKDAYLPYRVIIDRDTLSPYVDLAMVRARGGDYLPLLSPGARYQIRRARRLFEQSAPVQVEVARDLPGAVELFDQLVSLHEQNWTRKGKAGAFALDFHYRLHRRLIERRFPHGEIQLLKIASGGTVLAYLYNFVYRKQVYFYQSAIKYRQDNRLKPGFIAHAEAIAHNAAEGNDVYDFAGEGELYKKRLATHHKRLVWVRFQKPHIKFRIENKLKQKKQKIRSLMARLSARIVAGDAAQQDRAQQLVED